MLDVDHFLKVLSDSTNVSQSDRIKSLLKAESLYRGDFFEEYSYESYLETEREQLRHTFLNILIELARYYWDCKDYINGMKYYEKSLEKDPYQDHVYVEYIDRLL
ncbi:hypothetical protein BIV60_00240 [Bacillus sp. MUM 116]|nr:hypothetical protein BIV60_00240 [Bacillus sp. MUM 116]